MNVNLKELGLIIKQERKFRKWSQQDLARYVEVDQATISRVERGSDLITFDVYKKVCSQIGVKVNENHEEELTRLFDGFYQTICDYDQEACRTWYQKHIIDNPTVYHNELPVLKLIKAFYYYLFNQKDDLDQQLAEMMKIEDQYTGYYKMRYLQVLGGKDLVRTINLEESHRCIEEAYYYMIDHQIVDGFLYYMYGWTSFVMGNHATSVIACYESKKYFEARHNDYRLTGIQYLLGCIELNDGNYKDSLKIFLDCRANESFCLKNTLNFYLLHGLIGINFMYLKEYDLAIENLQMVFEKTNDPKALFFLLVCLKLSNQHEKLKQYLIDITHLKHIDHKRYRKIFSQESKLDLFENTMIKEIEDIIKKHNLSNFSFFIMKETLEEVYRLRQYTIYKNLFDVYLSLRVGDYHD